MRLWLLLDAIDLTRVLLWHVEIIACFVILLHRLFLGQVAIESLRSWSVAFFIELWAWRRRVLNLRWHLDRSVVEFHWRHNALVGVALTWCTRISTHLWWANTAILWWSILGWVGRPGRTNAHRFDFAVVIAFAEFARNKFRRRRWWRNFWPLCVALCLRHMGRWLKMCFTLWLIELNDALRRWHVDNTMRALAMLMHLHAIACFGGDRIAIVLWWSSRCCIKLSMTWLCSRWRRECFRRHWLRLQHVIVSRHRSSCRLLELWRRLELVDWLEFRPRCPIHFQRFLEFRRRHRRKIAWNVRNSSGRREICFDRLVLRLMTVNLIRTPDWLDFHVVIALVIAFFDFGSLELDRTGDVLDDWFFLDFDSFRIDWNLGRDWRMALKLVKAEKAEKKRVRKMIFQDRFVVTLC